MRFLSAFRGVRDPSAGKDEGTGSRQQPASFIVYVMWKNDLRLGWPAAAGAGAAVVLVFALTKSISL